MMMPGDEHNINETMRASERRVDEGEEERMRKREMEKGEPVGALRLYISQHSMTTNNRHQMNPIGEWLFYFWLHADLETVFIGARRDASPPAAHSEAPT